MNKTYRIEPISNKHDLSVGDLVVHYLDLTTKLIDPDLCKDDAYFGFIEGKEIIGLVLKPPGEGFASLIEIQWLGNSNEHSPVCSAVNLFRFIPGTYTLED